MFPATQTILPPWICFFVRSHKRYGCMKSIFFLKAKSPALARWFLPGGKSIFVPFQRSGLETIFRTSSQRGARKFLCGRSPNPPPGGGSGGRARCLPQAHQVCGGPAHYPSCFWGTALIIPPASGDYFKYHPQAWQRKGGEKQGWCQDTRSRVMGRIAALSFDFSCEGQGTFPSRFCLKLAGLVPGKGAPEEGRFIPTPGCSAEPRELQALPWGGKGRSCVYGLGNREQKQWLSLCEEGSDRRGDKRLDVAEGQEKSAGE